LKSPAACVAPFVSACGSSPQSLIVGKWQVSGAQVGGVYDEGAAAAAGKSIRMSTEFKKDGTARTTIMGQTHTEDSSDRLLIGSAR
jgi:hypothetical protein